MGGGMGPAAMLDFAVIDADGDGKLTPAEMEAHARARFAAADSDGDGKLSAEEMQTAAVKRQEENRARKAGQMAARMLERMDADGDGALSFEELPGRQTGAERMFSRLDTDGDGAISRAELDKARSRFGERRGEGRHHGKRWME